MRRGLFKRFTGLILAGSTMTMLFTGCGKQTSSGDSIVDQAVSSTKDYVFATELLDIADGQQIDFSRLSITGDRVYASTYGDGGKINLYSFNSDGSNVKNVQLPLSDNENYQYLVVDKDENIYAISYIYNWDFEDEDGEMHLYDEGGVPEPIDDDKAMGTAGDDEDGSALESSEEAIEEKDTAHTDDKKENPDESASDESSEEASDEEVVDDSEDVMDGSEEEIYLIKFDPEGNELDRVDLKEKFAGDDNYTSVNGMVVTDEGEVIISLEEGIVKYDGSDFKTLYDISANGEYRYYQIYKGFDNKYFVSSYGDKGIELCSFDITNGTIGEPSTALTGYTDYSFFGGNGYDLYISDGAGFYGYDLASDSMTKIMDYVDSDLELNSSTNQVAAISDVEFVGIFPDSEYNYYLARLTKVAPEDVKDKQVITIGGYYIDYDVRKQAFAYNKQSNDYKFKFVDYSTYDSDEKENGGIEQMNMDIISGNVPDIILLNDSMPVDSYINKGLFADLTTYISNDSDFSQTEFITNIMDAFKTGDKLYQLVPSFYVSTMVVKTKFTDGKDTLTFKDCTDLINKMGVKPDSSFGIIARNDFVESGLRYSGNTYIDWSSKSCNFNSDSFIEFLEFANTLPSEYQDGVWDNYKDSLYMTDDALFSLYSLSDFTDYTFLKRARFGDDISFVGFPNDMGINNSIIYPTKRMAISASSKYKDVAWEFLKSFYSEDYQDNIDYGFPVRKSSFDKKAEAATHKPFYMDGDKKVEYDQTYYIDGVEVKVDPLSSEEVLFVTNFIKSLKLVNSYNENVNNIIFEEASAYFSGQKTAKEVADIIQSRLSIYVNENS